jgi:hypothetical protein
MIETLQKEMNKLNYKVDLLYQMVESMSKQINSVNPENSQELKKPSNVNVVSQKNPIISPLSNSLRKLSQDLSDNYENSDFHLINGHKDIIDDNDNNYSENYDYSSSQGEYEMSSELQVQRLTAQLTAAYHRIAALEEQLLAQRIQ